MTLADLAEKIGVEPATVQRHESGKRQINWQMIRKYSDALGCHPSDITDGPGQQITPRTENEVAVLKMMQGMSEREQAAFKFALEASQAAAKIDQNEAPKEESGPAQKQKG